MTVHNLMVFVGELWPCWLAVLEVVDHIPVRYFIRITRDVNNAITGSIQMLHKGFCLPPNERPHSTLHPPINFGWILVLAIETVAKGVLYVRIIVIQQENFVPKILKVFHSSRQDQRFAEHVMRGRTLQNNVHVNKV
eukprot:CAMPEP_0178483230 /NCGR_PEP_ID=MMETSP0696-20121128/7128_1 /TAXON_ID=265572 /ORGANISM="Extubocellulus spinifer, Strain CCMP396" /LENGTH=136 /DNA_ID=CAMNT_0020110743 /DNA_START=458 /DNA_END=868 /DNA_ORIENTATION=-